MNQINLLGSLGRDPETKTLDNGTVVTKFSMATNHKQKEGDEWVDKTTWHNVTAFGKKAEVMAKYLVKGSKVLVTGRLDVRTYEGKDGSKKLAVEVVVNDFEFAGGKSGDSREARDAESETQTAPSAPKTVKNYAPGANPPAMDSGEELGF